jgi:hypothetical protein
MATGVKNGRVGWIASSEDGNLQVAESVILVVLFFGVGRVGEEIRKEVRSEINSKHKNNHKEKSDSTRDNIGSWRTT